MQIVEGLKARGDDRLVMGPGSKALIRYQLRKGMIQPVLEELDSRLTDPGLGKAPLEEFLCLM